VKVPGSPGTIALHGKRQWPTALEKGREQFRSPPSGLARSALATPLAAKKPPIPVVSFLVFMPTPSLAY
jgi:hypothetical protein